MSADDRRRVLLAIHGTRAEAVGVAREITASLMSAGIQVRAHTDVPVDLPGAEVVGPGSVAAETVADGCELVIVVGGDGTMLRTVHLLEGAGVPVIGVNVAESATRGDKSGRLKFRNLRSQLWWQIRELLDPAANTGMTLPPDQRLLADLTAPRWELSNATIQVESRNHLAKLMRSIRHLNGVSRVTRERG